MALESGVRARAQSGPPPGLTRFGSAECGARASAWGRMEWEVQMPFMNEDIRQADRHSSQGQNPDRTNSAKPKELFVWPSNWCIGHRGRKTHSLSTYCVPGSGLNCLHTWSHLTSQKSCRINACCGIIPIIEIKNKQTEAQRKQVCFRLNNQSQVEVSNLGLSDVNACVLTVIPEYRAKQALCKCQRIWSGNNGEAEETDTGNLWCTSCYAVARCLNIHVAHPDLSAVSMLPR